MWIHYGKGKKIGYLPLHDLFDKLGHQFCRALLKCYLGTGCDYLSTVGTKKSALAANPEQNLPFFGEPINLTEAQISEAEEYLMDVYSGVRTIKAAKNRQNWHRSPKEPQVSTILDLLSTVKKS